MAEVTKPLTIKLAKQKVDMATLLDQLPDATENERDFLARMMKGPTCGEVIVKRQKELEHT
eukprot:13676772-Alexandrium_andersonii.AAC.1